jgi:hypothetical protein
LAGERGELELGGARVGGDREVGAPATGARSRVRAVRVRLVPGGRGPLGKTSGRRLGLRLDWA